VCQPAGDFPDPPAGDLVMLKNHTPMRGRWNFGSEWVSRGAAGALSLVPAGVATKIVVDHPHAFRALAIRSDLVHAFLHRSGLDARSLDDSPLQAKQLENAVLANLVDGLWREVSSPAAFSRMFAEGALLTIFAELLRIAGEPMPLAKGGLSPSKLRRACDYLEAHLDGDPSLADVAKELDVSVAHFCRAFKAATGLPPHTWLVHRRIDEGCRLLITTNKNVTAIAAEVGYDDPNNFARMFRKIRGTSPNGWRRNTRD
jgi:AraC family transcriptional regulator